MAGRRAVARSCAARSSSASAGTGWATVTRGRYSGSRSSPSWTSSGIESITGRGRPLLGDLDRALDQLGDAPVGVHLERPLGDGREQRGQVDLLERLPVHDLVVDLPDQRDDRDRLPVGVVHRDHEVGGAGAARGHADAGTAGGAGEAVGHEPGHLLVAHGDEADRRVVVQRVEQVQRGGAGEPEDVGDALVGERLDRRVGGGRGRRAGSRRRGHGAKVWAIHV